MSEDVIKQFDMKYFNEVVTPLLSPHEVENWSAEFGRGLDVYLKRIERIGITGQDTVLDAGGGAGNWSIPLSMLNRKVELIDIQDSRLMIANNMIKRLSINNININNMSIEDLRFPDNHFDTIVCYSVIMFTDIKKSLAEFNRVLKPEGSLFVQTDLWRWYWGQGFPSNVNKLTYSVRFIAKKILFDRPAMLTIKRFRRMIESAGFQIVSIDQDGETSFLSEKKKCPKTGWIPTRPQGREELIEVCATKQ